MSSGVSGTKKASGGNKLTSAGDNDIIDVKAFDDMPKSGQFGGWEFEGNGQAVVDFFNNNSNYNELINQMSSDERESFSEYASGYFMAGQIYNGGFASLGDGYKDRIRTYDKYLDQAYLEKGIELRRRSDAQLIFGKGKTHATLEELQSMEGAHIISRGNLSTSAAKEGLLIGFEKKKAEKPMEYIIKIPGKTKGAGMWIGDDRINGWGVNQREFMTNRDIAFKVGKTKYNKSRDVFETELLYTGRLEHDYGGE